MRGKVPSKEFLVEMASHEKESGSERASARPEPPLRTGTAGHTRVRTCGPRGWRLSVAECQGRATLASTREMGMGVMSARGREAAAEGTRGEGLPRAVCPQGPGHFLGTSRPRPQGTAPFPRRSALLIKGAGGEGAGLCEQRPGCAPPHLPAPLPREFVKQISLIAQAKEFVGEKSRGNSPPLGHPFPASLGAAGAERAGPPHDPRLCRRL